MQTIFKYELPIQDTFTLTLPKGTHALHVGMQREIPCLWCLVDPDEDHYVEHAMRCYGTGHPVPAVPGHYLGTVLMRSDSLVFHFFSPTLPRRSNHVEHVGSQAE